MRDELDIVYLSCCEKWWDWERRGFVSRPALVARELAACPDVRTLLVVNTPSSVVRRALSAARREQHPGTGLSHAGGKVHVLDQVRLLPKERSRPGAFRVNGALHDEALAATLRRAMRTLGMERPVMWLTGPHDARSALRFPDALVVYDAMDEWAAMPEMAAMRREIESAYEVLRARADLVFAVTPSLAGRFAGGRPSVRVVPNGVDPARFAESAPMPADLAALGRPVVGYVGMLQDRVDVDLVREIARRMPSVRFAFVGPVLDPRHFEPLSGVANVHFLGARPPSEVPGWIAGFDACFLPHVDSPLTRAMDPLKLYEYVAAGKPVVASDLPFEQPRELVRKASGAEGFAADLRAALSGDWRPDETVRNAHVRACEWRARVDAMLGYVREARDRAGVPGGPASAQAGDG